MLHAIPKEPDIVKELQNNFPLTADLRLQAHVRAHELVEDLRRGRNRGGMSGYSGRLLNHYRLSDPQGLALMELAEAYIRTPDAATRRELLEDKILPQIWLDNPKTDWLRYDLFTSIKATGYGLEFLRWLLQLPESDKKILQKIREFISTSVDYGVQQFLQLTARQFVAAETIEKAYDKCNKGGYRTSFDMLGEAARTEADALRYFADYKGAIRHVGEQSAADGSSGGAPQTNKHGVSVKLSALYGRYELLQAEQVQAVLLPRLLELLELCKSYNIGLTIDAEESARLELSLGLVEELLKTGMCRHWQGLSIAVQAYNKRSFEVIDKLCELARQNDSLLAIRLVKGAYWDEEIKTAQVKGLTDFHTYTIKNHTDVAYICLATRLLQAAPLVYPQFATHNAYTASAISILAEQYDAPPAFEFQHGYGMGEDLHKTLRKEFGYPYRVYVPVGAHKDLLPYLIRRMLENGANGAFLYQFADASVEVRDVIADPLHILQTAEHSTHPQIKSGADMFLPERGNSNSGDCDDMGSLEDILAARKKFDTHKWQFGKGKGKGKGSGQGLQITNPCDSGDIVGNITMTSAEQVAAMVGKLKEGKDSWAKTPVKNRAALLHKIADNYEKNRGELMALLTREAGKSLHDAIDEVREAVDFCRYYAHRVESLPDNANPRGLVVCISPWNFPLAIFTGQIVAALVSGNVVLAKPAEQTPLIAHRAVELMRGAGIPEAALQLAILNGEDTAAHVTRKGTADMVAFTGSTDTAHLIEADIANSSQPAAPLLAETGGINAMVIDSTALLERAVDDVVASAFQSAGQRCSAVRMVYVQDDIYDNFVTMLKGAMDLLKIGDSRKSQTDIGALIEKSAQQRCHEYLQSQKSNIIHQTALEEGLENKGHYIAPTLLACGGIGDVKEEIFAPILHIARFKAGELAAVVEAINGTGYGLTFGLHSRIGERCRRLADKVKAGNIYVNRNQIGAVVGSQPFGGYGLSGTGPKAGGHLYVQAFCKGEQGDFGGDHQLAGHEGEDNAYHIGRRRLMLCGAGAEHIITTARKLLEAGFDVDIHDRRVTLNDFGADTDKTRLNCHGDYDDAALRTAEAIVWCGKGKDKELASLRQAIAASGAIVPLTVEEDWAVALWWEKHICTDTTAIGGNPTLWSRV